RRRVRIRYHCGGERWKRKGLVNQRTEENETDDWEKAQHREGGYFPRHALSPRSRTVGAASNRIHKRSSSSIWTLATSDGPERNSRAVPQAGPRSGHLRVVATAGLTAETRV